ncbi:hypothetical protein SRABI133_03431 [Peribacillus simplex]|uniref:Uncharacterized protein n=1 Tax=Peribacillus simplex TaxID=1478 RepID=A0A9W4KYH8_9BACI|nr:hypothetical protein SRABI133_03431 [Peribacillus simplex]
MPRGLLLYILVVIMAGVLSLFLCLFAQLRIKDAPGAKPYILVTYFSGNQMMNKIKKLERNINSSTAKIHLSRFFFLDLISNRSFLLNLLLFWGSSNR